MRKLLVGYLLVLLGILPLAGADDNILEHCTNEDLQIIVDADRKFRNVVESTDSVSEPLELLEYSHSYINWRDELRTILPKCGQSLEIGLSMSQIAGDSLLSLGLEMIAVPAEENKYLAELEKNSARLESARVALNGRDELKSPESEALEDQICSLLEEGTDYDLIEEYQAMFGTINAVRTVEDIQNYMGTHLTYRENLWMQLQACADVFEIALLHNQLTSDLVATLILHAVGISSESNPFFDQIGYASKHISELYGRRMIETSSLEVIPLESNLPACARDELRIYVDVSDAYEHLVGLMMQGISGSDDLADYAAAQIGWRNALLPKLTLCAEAVEYGLLMSWINGDFISSEVLKLIGVSSEENFFLKNRESDKQRLAHLHTQVFEIEDAGEMPEETTVLAACLDDEWNLLFGDIMDDFLLVRDSAVGIGTLEEWLQFGVFLSSWRNSLWSQLPACSEAAETGILMNMGASDLSASIGFRALGISKDRDHYWNQISEHSARFDEIAAARGES